MPVYGSVPFSCLFSFPNPLPLTLSQPFRLLGNNQEKSDSTFYRSVVHPNTHQHSVPSSLPLYVALYKLISLSLSLLLSSSDIHKSTSISFFRSTSCQLLKGCQAKQRVPRSHKLHTCVNHKPLAVSFFRWSLIAMASSKQMATCQEDQCRESQSSSFSSSPTEEK